MSEVIFSLKVDVEHPTLFANSKPAKVEKHLSQIQKIIGELLVDMQKVIAIGYVVPRSPQETATKVSTRKKERLKIPIRASAREQEVLSDICRIIAQEFENLKLPVLLTFQFNE